MRSVSGGEMQCSAHRYGKTPLLLLHPSLTEPLLGTAAGRKREERFETKTAVVNRGCGTPMLSHTICSVVRQEV